MNNIPDDQVRQKQLDRLAAQRQLYSDAKRIQAIQIVLTVLGVVVWSFLVLWNPQLKVYAALWGFCVALVDILILTPWQKKLKQQAAQVQELFDCDVLQLEWRDLKVGGRPDAETIAAFSARYKNKDPKSSTLRDWYPVSVGKLPLHLARILCQRVSCRWDGELRRRYAQYTVVMVGGISLFVFLLGLIGGLTLDKFLLAVLAPLLPLFVLGLRQYQEHNESAGARDHLKEHADKLWQSALANDISAEELTKRSRDLQDEIFDNRRRSPLIPDRIYERLRDKYEAQMNRGVEALVEEALEKVR